MNRVRTMSNKLCCGDCFEPCSPLRRRSCLDRVELCLLEDVLVLELVDLEDDVGLEDEVTLEDVLDLEAGAAALCRAEELGRADPPEVKADALLWRALVPRLAEDMMIGCQNGIRSNKEAVE